MYETINSPVNYGGLTLKNRIIFAPTSMSLSEDELIARYRAIAAGGCAMIILGDVPGAEARLRPVALHQKGLRPLSAHCRNRAC